MTDDILDAVIDATDAANALDRSEPGPMLHWAQSFVTHLADAGYVITPAAPTPKRTPAPILSGRGDRTVHARQDSYPHLEVVRYDRSGKWWLEYPSGTLIPARRVNVTVAADKAAGFLIYRTGTVNFGRPGGRTFDQRVRRKVALHVDRREL